MSDPVVNARPVCAHTEQQIIVIQLQIFLCPQETRKLSDRIRNSFLQMKPVFREISLQIAATVLSNMRA